MRIGERFLVFEPMGPEESFNAETGGISFGVFIEQGPTAWERGWLVWNPRERPGHKGDPFWYMPAGWSVRVDHTWEGRLAPRLFPFQAVNSRTAGVRRVLALLDENTRALARWEAERPSWRGRLTSTISERK